MFSQNFIRGLTILLPPVLITKYSKLSMRFKFFGKLRCMDGILLFETGWFLQFVFLFYSKPPEMFRHKIRVKLISDKIKKNVNAIGAYPFLVYKNPMNNE